MMLEHLLNQVGDVEIFIAGAGAVVFAASYGAFFSWRKTAAGKALMYFILSLIGLCLLNALGRWIGDDYLWRPYLRFTVYTAIAVTIWRLVIVLWRNWRRGDETPLDVETRHRDEQIESKEQ